MSKQFLCLKVWQFFLVSAPGIAPPLIASLGSWIILIALQLCQPHYSRNKWLQICHEASFYDILWPLRMARYWTGRILGSRFCKTIQWTWKDHVISYCWQEIGEIPSCSGAGKLKGTSWYLAFLYRTLFLKIDVRKEYLVSFRGDFAECNIGRPCHIIASFIIAEKDVRFIGPSWHLLAQRPQK